MLFAPRDTESCDVREIAYQQSPTEGRHHCKYPVLGSQADVGMERPLHRSGIRTTIYLAKNRDIVYAVPSEQCCSYFLIAWAQLIALPASSCL